MLYRCCFEHLAKDYDPVMQNEGLLLAENQVNYNHLYWHIIKNISIKPFHTEFNFISFIPDLCQDSVMTRC